MSVNHTKRYEKVVDDALKLASVGEAYGFSVCGPAMYPMIVQRDGEFGLTPPAMGWYVQVSIKATGVGEPDIVNGFPIPGYLPGDDAFRITATNMLEMCRQERERDNAQAVAAASLAQQRRLAQGG